MFRCLILIIVAFIYLCSVHKNCPIEAAPSDNYRRPRRVADAAARPAFDSSDMKSRGDSGGRPIVGTAAVAASKFKTKSDEDQEEQELPVDYDDDEEERHVDEVKTDKKKLSPSQVSSSRAGSSSSGKPTTPTTTKMTSAILLTDFTPLISDGNDTAQEQPAFGSSSGDQSISVINPDDDQKFKVQADIVPQINETTILPQSASGADSASKWILYASLVLLLVIFIVIFSICIICYQKISHEQKKDDEAVKDEATRKKKKERKRKREKRRKDKESKRRKKEKKDEKSAKADVLEKKIVEQEEKTSAVATVVETTTEKPPEKSTPIVAEKTKSTRKRRKKKKREEKREKEKLEGEQRVESADDKVVASPEKSPSEPKSSSLTIPAPIEVSGVSCSDDEESLENNSLNRQLITKIFGTKRAIRLQKPNMK